MFDKNMLKESLFNWEDLNGKTLTIGVSKDISEDGETILVSGYSKKENKHYILHAIVKDEQLI
jgi:hypothetical protein